MCHVIVMLSLSLIYTVQSLFGCAIVKRIIPGRLSLMVISRKLQCSESMTVILFIDHKSIAYNKIIPRGVRVCIWSKISSSRREAKYQFEEIGGLTKV